MGVKHIQVFPVFSRGKRARLPHPGTLHGSEMMLDALA